jgi:hypothetical protein
MTFGKDTCYCLSSSGKDTIAYVKFCTSKDIPYCFRCICRLLYDNGITTNTMTLTGGVTLVLLKERILTPEKYNEEM